MEVEVFKDERLAIGDAAEVIDNMQCYTDYTEWVNKHIRDSAIRNEFVQGKIIAKGDVVKILDIGKHDRIDDEIVCYVQEVQGNHGCYLIEKSGLRYI